MDLTKTEQVSGSFIGMSELPIVRQLGLLVGLAVSIALGTAIVLWARTPEYKILYANVSGQGASEIVHVLQRLNIGYKLDISTGAVMVEADKVQQAKLELSAEGLPRSTGVGFELLQKEERIGTSSFLQNARYHRAKEEELARTIMTMNSIRKARIHLALPKESAFIRDQKMARASVLLELATGDTLPKRQVSAITHLVASSVSNLSVENVTVVDSNGNLLTSQNDPDGLAITDSQFEHTRRLEQHYISRIENILTPLVGKGKVRAQVVADIDFTKTEMTSESFIPDRDAIRSEQKFEEQSTGSNVSAGVPGALSNEPPAAGQAPENVTQTGSTVQQSLPGKKQRRSTLNFELDKTISHTKKSPAKVRRLSVAVVVDDKISFNKKKEIIYTSYKPEEIETMTRLVKEAIGYSAFRGDSVNVVNSRFSPVEKPKDLPELQIWEKSWFWSVVKQSVAAIAVLLIVFGVLRPTFRSLAKNRPPSSPLVDHENGLALEDQTVVGADGQITLPKPKASDNDLQMAKQVASDEPKLVAQVVKHWISDEND